MSSSYGHNIRVTIFGQSHSKAIGVTIEGIPAGFRIDEEELLRFLQRRAPGRSALSTPRAESDTPEFLSGIKDGYTCGTPITAVIQNKNTRSEDYAVMAHVPRPGHADLTGYLKYGEHRDYAGGGHFSGRLTAPLCIAGGIFKQILAAEGIRIVSKICSIGGICDDGPVEDAVFAKDFPVANDAQGEKMKELILQKKQEGDSVGGVVECHIYGLPCGLGDPIFDGMENRIAAAIFGIPAVKGIEFGDGFASAELCGSENNDAFGLEEGRIVTLTNHCGGILGGITNGMPLVFRAAIKPTPSIAKEQKSVDMIEKKETTIRVPGRHDPCIVPRVLPCIEAAAAIAVYDAYLEQKKYR